VLDWSLVHGALPVVLVVVGALAMVLLLWPRGRARRWWSRSVLPAVGGALVTAAVVALVSRTVLAERLPRTVWAWLVAALAGIALALVARRAGARRTTVTALAVVVVVAAMSGVNHYYGEIPPIRTALGLGYADEIETLPGQAAQVVAPADWVPPPGMPATGRVAEVDIPGPSSGFDARPGWVYLPPAYLGSVRAELPVLVLLSGQPGGPSDWLDGGQLAARMDRYAAAHHGLAPVVVMPDALGSELADPLCLDSQLGHVATYLGVDVPAWIGRHLQVGAPRAVGGLSYGGTCALQLAVTAPSAYPTFVDISGQAEPSLGTRADTVAAAFGDGPGADAAFRAVNPLDLLAARRYPMTAGAIVVGAQDREYRHDAQTVAAALRAAQVPETYAEVPGAHTWGVWGPGLERMFPWLGTRLGIPG